MNDFKLTMPDPYLLHMFTKSEQRLQYICQKFTVIMEKFKLDIFHIYNMLIIGLNLTFINKLIRLSRLSIF